MLIQNGKRILAVLVTALLIVTGMYSEIRGIDSSFARTEKQESQAVLTTMDGCFSGLEMCTGEMLGLYRLDRSETVCRLTDARLAKRTRGQSGLMPVILEKTFSKSCITYKLTEILQPGEACSKTVIISYIHHQDGSKR